MSRLVGPQPEITCCLVIRLTDSLSMSLIIKLIINLIIKLIKIGKNECSIESLSVFQN